ncbi:MAG TPA: ABC transporter permease [Thermoanaerobaculia bacterium]|nr:ABC transporter permease [Thermoanaerobaculia bacterium]
MTAFVQDLRYAARTLAKSPGFTIAAIVILALGIGANTAIFSLMDAVVLHPLPAVARPQALVDVAGQTASYPWYRSVRDATATNFEGLAAWRQREISLSSGDAPSRVRGVVVSGNYFDVLGARPAAGRLFTPADETSGEALVVLGQGLWRSRFGSDPSIAGKAIQLNGSPFTVVGVAPSGLRGTGFGLAPDLWVPIGAWPHLATGEFRTLDLERRGWGWLTVFGRLKPGVSLPQAQASLDLAVRQEAAAFPDGAPGTEKRTLEPTLRNAAGFGQSGNPVGVLALLVGAAGIALAIACANLANLLLARAAARRKEIAVRQALGASRGRLVRQLLTESVALGVLGGAAGLVVASWSIGLITRMPLPGDFSFAIFAPALDARALGFSLLLSVGTGLAFGLIPALQTSGHAVSATLKASGTSVAPRTTARGTLLVIQVSLCLLLLVGAGLLGRSLQRALAIDVGFQPRGLTLASVNLGLQRYESPRADAFLRDLRQRVAAVPGVRFASWAGLVPMGSGEWVENFSIEGRPESPAGKHPEAGVNLVAADFYRTMGIPLADGREFDDRLDRADSAPVAVVNESMARRYWPDGAVGRRIMIGGAERTVVGVSRDFRTGSLRDGATPQVYMPLAQSPGSGLRTMTLVVRGDDPRTDVGSLVRAKIRELDPTLPVADIHPYAAELAGQLVPQRLGSALLGVFGLLCLALAAVGIYAVISYSVAGRTREIGIRMALGARAADVRTLVVAQSARPVGVGLALGLGLGAAAAFGLRGFLFGVSPADPLTFAAVTALLAACALVAAWLPARRASKIDPALALRAD